MEKYVSPQVFKLLNASEPLQQKAERVFLACIPYAFESNFFAWSDIKKRVANAFNVPAHHVLVCGSAMIGYSIAKDRPFKAGDSDLDVAIVDGALFIRCLEEAYRVTKKYSDNTLFPRNDGVNALELFTHTAVRQGMIRMDLMPRSPLKEGVTAALKNASAKYASLFSSINCAIYASENLFIQKQVKLLEMTGKKQ